jgi:hypothetical protein
MQKITAKILMTVVLGCLSVFSAQAQTVSWSGTNIRFTSLSGSTCRITIDRAYLQGGGALATVRVVFRNRGAAPARITADVELQGSGQRKSGRLGPVDIAAASTADVAVMQPFGGSLAGTILSVKLQSCQPTN